MTMNNLTIGQTYKVVLSVVRAHCNMPPYLRLVNQTIRNADNGKVLLAEINENTGMAMIRSHQFDFLGDVQIPIEALI